MELYQALAIIILLSARVSLSLSFNLFDKHVTNPGICGGHCRGDAYNGNPCFGMFNQEGEECKWANDHCCPPYGTGNEWTTTTTTTTTTTPSTTSAHKESILKHWKIELIVVGAIVGVALIAGIAYFLYRRICKNKSTTEQRYEPPPLANAESNYAYAEENPNFGTSDDYYGTTYS